MKIAFLFGTMQRGGAERVIASLANSFCAQGDSVSIITLDGAKSGYHLYEQVEHIRMNLAGNSQNKLEAIKRNLRIIKRLRAQIKKDKYDVVVSFSTKLAIQLIYAFPFGRKVKLIVSERGNPQKRIIGKLEEFLYDHFLPNVDGFIFQTERVSECYSEKLRRIGTVIHNGVFPEILPGEEMEFERRNHNEICAVGRLCEQKGYDVLLLAFQQFVDTHPNHRLNIFGEGPLRKQIEQLIFDLDLADKVTLHGSVPNVMFQAGKMGMFVLPSRFEGMPNALMEAMACGIPSIAADCDFGPGELIRDGENGLLVQVDHVEGLADAMRRIADNPNLAQKLSRNAREIRNTHSGDRIASLYRGYILDVIKRG